MDLRIVFRSSEICCCGVALKIFDDHLQLRVKRLFKLFKFSLPPIAFTSFFQGFPFSKTEKKLQISKGNIGIQIQIHIVHHLGSSTKTSAVHNSKSTCPSFNCIPPWMQLLQLLPFANFA